MARKSKSDETEKKIRYLRIDVTSDEDFNWLHGMRTSKEKERDEEIAEWFKQQLIPYESKRRKLQSED
jgi:hypothetical protein